METLPSVLKELDAPAAVLDREARILDANEAFEALFPPAVESGAASGPAAPEALSARVAAGSKPALMAALVTPEWSSSVDVELVAGERWVRLFAAPLDRKVVRGPVLILASDISDLHPERIKQLHALESEFFKSEQELFEDVRSIFDWRKEIKRKIYGSIMHQGLTHFAHALFQGNSLGGLMSLLSMILDSGLQPAETETFAPLLRDYYKNTMNTVDTLRRVGDLFGTHGHFRSVPAAEVARMLKQVKHDVEGMAAIKRQQILLSEAVPPPDRSFHADPALLAEAVKELLVNAMKYGPARCNILMLVFFSESEFILKVVNPVEAAQRMDVEELDRVFDPFYRHAQVIDERYTGESFGYGLGMTAVRQISVLHDARIFLLGLHHSGLTGADEDVCATFSLAYEERTEQGAALDPHASVRQGAR